MICRHTLIRDWQPGAETRADLGFVCVLLQQFRPCLMALLPHYSGHDEVKAAVREGMGEEGNAQACSPTSPAAKSEPTPPVNSGIASSTHRKRSERVSAWAQEFWVECTLCQRWRQVDELLEQVSVSPKVNSR